jgi:hypothetical protein
VKLKLSPQKAELPWLQLRIGSMKCVSGNTPRTTPCNVM